MHAKQKSQIWRMQAKQKIRKLAYARQTKIPNLGYAGQTKIQNLTYAGQTKNPKSGVCTPIINLDFGGCRPEETNDANVQKHTHHDMTDKNTAVSPIQTSHPGYVVTRARIFRGVVSSHRGRRSSSGVFVASRSAFLARGSFSGLRCFLG